MRIYLREASLAWLCHRERIQGKPRRRGRSWYQVLKEDDHFKRAFNLLHGGDSSDESVYQVTKEVLRSPGLSAAEVKSSPLYRKLCRFERWLKDRASEAVGYDPSLPKVRMGCRSFEQMMEEIARHQDEYEIITTPPFVATLPRWERRRVLKAWRDRMREYVEAGEAAADGDAERVAQLRSWYWLRVDCLREREVRQRISVMVGASVRLAQVRAWAVAGERVVAEMKPLAKG